MEPFIGEIRLFAINFAPRGWADCNGKLMDLQSNAVLFSILGTTYGGDGKTSFALPDLRGCAAVGAGAGPGLPNINLGEVVGAETVRLTTSNLPSHTHIVSTYASNADSDLAEVGDETRFLSRYKVKGLTNVAEHFRSPSIPGPTVNVQMSPSSIGVTGGNQPHENMQPYLTMRYCIALDGIYPSRS